MENQEKHQDSEQHSVNVEGSTKFQGEVTNPVSEAVHAPTVETPQPVAPTEALKPVEPAVVQKSTAGVDHQWIWGVVILLVGAALVGFKLWHTLP